MARIKVMKLWTAIVTAFLALCTALGLITTTSAAATQPETRPETRSSTASHTTTPAVSPWSWACDRSLPPTMKQRIRAEAHGKSPSCRHRPSADADTATDAADEATTDYDSVAPVAPLQR